MPDHSSARSRRPGATLAALAALVLILAACSSAGSPSQAAQSQAAESQAAESQPATGGTTVTMSGLAFDVPEITVPAGNVTFVNTDAVNHIVAEGENAAEVADPRITKTTVTPSSQADVAFAAPGDYHVTCLVHAAMNMVVHVE